MPNQKKLTFFLTIFCGSLFLVSLCFAGVRGNIRGTITDSKGEPIAGVKISIQSHRVAKEVYEIDTGEDGRFSYVGLKPYLYKVTVEKEGYQTHIEPEFKIRAGKWVELYVTLMTLKELQEQHIEEMTPEQRANLYFNEALDAYNTSDFDTAIEKFNLAIENNPSLVRAHELKGVIYYTKKNDVENARVSFESTVVADESNTTAYEYLGAIAQKAGDEAKAVEYWTKYFDLGGDSGIVAENLSVIFLKKNDFASARKVLERGIEGESEYAPIYKKLGDSCMRLNDFQASLDAYRKYLELSPDAPDKPTVQAFIDALDKAVKKEEAAKAEE